MIGDITLALIAVLLLINLSYMVFTIYNSCKENKRKKSLAQQKESWEANSKAQKEMYLMVQAQ